MKYSDFRTPGRIPLRLSSRSAMTMVTVCVNGGQEDWASVTPNKVGVSNRRSVGHLVVKGLPGDDISLPHVTYWEIIWLQIIPSYRIKHTIHPRPQRSGRQWFKCMPLPRHLYGMHIGRKSSTIRAVNHHQKRQINPTTNGIHDNENDYEMTTDV